MNHLFLQKARALYLEHRLPDGWTALVGPDRVRLGAWYPPMDGIDYAGIRASAILTDGPDNLSWFPGALCMPPEARQ